MVYKSYITGFNGRLDELSQSTVYIGMTVGLRRQEHILAHEHNTGVWDQRICEPNFQTKLINQYDSVNN